MRPAPEQIKSYLKVIDGDESEEEEPEGPWADELREIDEAWERMGQQRAPVESEPISNAEADLRDIDRRWAEMGQINRAYEEPRASRYPELDDIDRRWREMEQPQRSYRNQERAESLWPELDDIDRKWRERGEENAMCQRDYDQMPVRDEPRRQADWGDLMYSYYGAPSQEPPESRDEVELWPELADIDRRAKELSRYDYDRRY
jgi:hypothetical protein